MYVKLDGEKTTAIENNNKIWKKKLNFKEKMLIE